MTDHPPHFSDFGWIAAEFSFGSISAGSFNRGFYAAELIRPGDRVLDIGCGDGFADRRLFAERAAHIDAIDIEPAAISRAAAENAAPNVTYSRLDAVTGAFPSERYDVVVWDGAIGHFPPETTLAMLERIRGALAPGGALSGSESLGDAEGAHDHLTFFAGLEDLAGMLGRVFPLVQVRERTYGLPDGSQRREAYFRCAVDGDRLADAWSDSRG